MFELLTNLEIGERLKPRDRTLNESVRECLSLSGFLCVRRIVVNCGCGNSVFCGREKIAAREEGKSVSRDVFLKREYTQWKGECCRLSTFSLVRLFESRNNSD